MIAGILLSTGIVIAVQSTGPSAGDWRIADQFMSAVSDVRETPDVLRYVDYELLESGRGYEPAEREQFRQLFRACTATQRMPGVVSSGAVPGEQAVSITYKCDGQDGLAAERSVFIRMSNGRVFKASAELGPSGPPIAVPTPSRANR